MEYQDYELWDIKRFKQDFKETQIQLMFRQEALAKVGILALKRIQELEFACYDNLAIKCKNKEARAKKKIELAKQKLRLAKKILKAAKSNNLAKKVKKAT